MGAGEDYAVAAVATRRGPKPRAGLPKCSRHPHSHIKRAGLYGKDKQARRQLYKCTPQLSADLPHRFAELLPRHPAPTRECDECERELPPTHGPVAPHHYAYSVRDIAWALVQAGSGVSYSSIARRLRRRAGRRSASIAAGGTGFSRDARLICDWIETYAPVVLGPLVIQSSPTTILADHLVFRVKALNAGKRPKSGGQDAFFVLAVAGQSPGSPTQMLRMETSRRRTTKDWIALFKKLPASSPPTRLVCDEEIGIKIAAETLWPNIEVTISPWHLQHRAGEYLRDARRHAVNHPLRVALNDAFKSQAEWTKFLVLVLKARAVGTTKQKKAIRGLRKWALDHNQTVLTQLTQHGWPVSTGALETQLRRVKSVLFDRRDAFTNKKRTDLLLGLITLHLNESDDQRQYAALLRDHLRANNGGPSVRRGRICDPKGQPSSLRG